MSFKPLGKRVLVEPVPPETKRGDILIPQAVQDYSKEGIVRAMARDCTDLAIGDRVMVERNYNTLIKVGGVKCWLLNQQDIVAVITNEPKENKRANS